jgi:IS4 transposase
VIWLTTTSAQLLAINGRQPTKEDRALLALERGMLLIFDLGFLNFTRFDQLTDAGVFFVTRKEERVVARTEQVLRRTATLHEQIVHLGSTAASQCVHAVRLVEWQHQGKWYRYLTNVLDPELLPAEYVVALYWQRWRIEDSFNVIKRLLGLAYFWTGSSNGIQNQVWATWLLYAVLVDLTDAVAEALVQPFQALSMEMVYRGLDHFTVAHHRGTVEDPIAYLAADAQGLGIIKRQRKNRGATTHLLYLTIPDPP